MVGITFMVDVYCIYGECYVYAREIELKERLPVPYDNYLKSLSSLSLCLWLIITKWVIQACMFCFPNVRHVIIFLGTVSSNLRLIPVRMYA